MELTRIIQLLIKRHRNEFSRNDQEELEQWLKQGDNHTQAKKWDQVWDLSGRYKSAYEPDLEAGLRRLQKRMKPNAARRRLRLALALAAVLLLGLLPFARRWWLPSADENSVIVHSTGAQQKEYTLPDGSRVWLRENSRLRYSGAWKGKARELQLEGEAFFKVVRDPRHPFIVYTGQTRVQVLGTSFNLRAYASELSTSVTVEEGLVAFIASSGELQLRLSDREKGIFDHSQQTLSRVEGPNLNARAWQTGHLRFRGTSLQQVVRELDEHLSVDLELQNPALLDCSFTFGSAAGESVDELLDNLAYTFNAGLEKLGNGRYILHGGRCSR